MSSLPGNLREIRLGFWSDRPSACEEFCVRLVRCDFSSEIEFRRRCSRAGPAKAAINAVKAVVGAWQHDCTGGSETGTIGGVTSLSSTSSQRLCVKAGRRQIRTEQPPPRP